MHAGWTATTSCRIEWCQPRAGAAGVSRLAPGQTGVHRQAAQAGRQGPEKQNRMVRSWRAVVHSDFRRWFCWGEDTRPAPARAVQQGARGETDDSACRKGNRNTKPRDDVWLLWSLWVAKGNWRRCPFLPHPHPTCMASGVVAREWAAGLLSAAANSATAGWLSPCLTLVGRRFLSCRTSVRVVPGMEPSCCALPAMAACWRPTGRTLEVERGTHQGLQRPRSLQGWGEGCPGGWRCADAGVERVGQRPAAQHGAADRVGMLGEQGHDNLWCKLRSLLWEAAVRYLQQAKAWRCHSWRCRRDPIV